MFTHAIKENRNIDIIFYHVTVFIFFIVNSIPAYSSENSPSRIIDHLLSQEERKWLIDHPVIVHGVSANDIPFEYVDDNGQHRGLTSEYVQILSDHLGVEFKRVKVRNYEELIRKMRSGEIQTASYLGPSAQDIHYSKPMIKVPIVLFGRQESSSISGLSEIVNESLAVENPSRASEILKRDFPLLSFKSTDSTLGGMKLVQSGKADLFMHNVFSVEYFQRRQDLTPLKIVSLTPYEFDIRFSANTSAAPLIPIVEKVFDDLSKRERRLIFDKWVNVEAERKVYLREILIYGSIFLSMILVVVLLILYWNRKLQHQVILRTHEIEMSKFEIRNLARHMEHVREEEKAKLSREIHDDLGHTLTALTMGIRHLAHLLGGTEFDRNSEKLHMQLSELKGLVKEASETSRRIMSDLRPSILEDFGLIAALEWLAHEFQSHLNIECGFKSCLNDYEFSKEACIALFRITQEALTNVAKHSGATFVTITLSEDEHLLRLNIKDNGVGLQPDWNVKSGSYGIKGIKERAIAFDGSVEVDNNPSLGMYLEVSFPLNRIHFKNQCC